MNIRRVFQSLLLVNRRQQAARRRLLKKVSDKLGFFYFGYVDNRDDEHKVVRGFSASSTHRDDSYIVGEYDDYSLSIVDRFDTIAYKKGVETHSWLIIDIELQSTKELPHMFMLPTHQKNVHYQKVFTAFRSLEKVSIGMDVAEFHSRYELYATPDQHDVIAELLDVDRLRVIAAHFWPIAIEITDKNVYFYLAEKKLTEHAITTFIKNSAWLCQTLDNTAK